MQAESLTIAHLGGSLFVFSCARNGAAVVAAHVAPVVYVSQSQFYEYSFLIIIYARSDRSDTRFLIPTSPAWRSEHPIPTNTKDSSDLGVFTCTASCLFSLQVDFILFLGPTLVLGVVFLQG